MFAQLVPVNKDVHATKKIRPIDSFSFAASFHLASVMIPEFGRASASYPIVFLEDKEQDAFRPVAMMGVEEGANLFVDDAGKWKSGYIPAIIRRYPFSLIRTETPDQFLVGIDGDSALLSDSEGAALFKEDGNPSELLEGAKQFLGELNQMELFTTEFAKFLAQHNMLTPLNLQVQEASGVRNISGAYVVNEERLNNLSDETFAEFRKKGYLPAIYAHLVSLGQIDRLLMMKAERLQAEQPAKSSSKKKATAEN
ncbi:MAG: hypothetical protein RIR70_1244 [Pseudomonadota bacterium]